MLDASKIKLNTVMSFLHSIDLAPRPIHLSPPGETRSDDMTKVIIRNDFMMMFLPRSHVRGVRAKPYKGHVSM